MVKTKLQIDAEDEGFNNSGIEGSVPSAKLICRGKDKVRLR
jgi:hypothetical protein